MEQPSIDSLKESLKKHAQAFDELLRLIPPKFYLPEEHEQILNNRYMKNTKKETEAKKKTEQRKARANAKSARLDPDNVKTVQEMQTAKLERASKEKGSSKSAAAANRLNHHNHQVNGTTGGASSAGSDNEWEDVVEDKGASETTAMAIDVDGTDADAQKKPAVAAADASNAVKPMPPAQSINDLRERLQVRIQSLRQKRKAPEDDGSREALLEKRMKRRENTKEAKAKAKKTGSGAVREQVLGKNTPMPSGAPSGTATAGGDELGVKNNLVFGKLTGMSPKKKKPIQTKQQLANIEGKMKNLEELRKVDSEKADQLEEKDKWGRALGQAKGEKIKDDVKLLRKAVRREDQKKRKSSREWNDRAKAEKIKMKERSDRRESNIKARVDAKKMKKQGKSKKTIARAIKGAKAASGPKKKGPAQKARPGFEGKKPSKK
ncbi:hypothetical protein H4217_001191 [Coemansia sp. RSA 1939]|nr:hypothetical protein H4217_001191 [Coemansia sp. RSA 1939]KAJ2616491.1 hypothetical protein EV177_001050 [Coemansia sp. RSA 1804]